MNAVAADAGAVIVAYDGACGLCHGFVRFLLRHDPAGKLRFAASDSASGAAIFAACGQDPAAPGAMVTMIDGRRITGADAVIAAVAALGGLWRLAQVLRVVPGALRGAAYRAVAARRLAWFGTARGCPVPQPGWAGRFLP